MCSMNFFVLLMTMIADIALFIFTLFCKSLLVVFFRCRFRTRVTFLQKVPFKGPYIITPNHESSFDPPLAGAFLLTPLRFMAKKELFKNIAFGLLLRAVGSMPLERRGFDAITIRKVMSHLKRGASMVIFPEGTRSKNDEMLRAKPGIGLILHEAGYPPVIPLRFRGTRIAEKELFSFARPRIDLVYGYPYCINPNYSWGTTTKESSQAMADYIMRQVQAL